MGSLGKYYPLEQYLDKANSSRITLSFDDIERIIGEDLPSSAKTYAEWWANNSKGHSHANSWLNVGVKVEQVKLGRFVVFSKSNIKTQDDNEQRIKTGKKYRHFKGNEYLVLHLAKHSETLEDLVVYKALYGDRGIWVRPLKMFAEQVEVNGRLVNRFQEIEDENYIMLENEISCTDVNRKEFEIKIVCDKNDDSKCRDACLKAYVCAVLDILPTEFNTFKKDKDKKGLIKLIEDDLERRLKTLLK